MRGLCHYVVRLSFATEAAKSKLTGGAEIVGRRFARTAIRYDFVRDLLAFAQCSKTSTFNRADVDEHVISAVIRLNETETLGRVKPLHCSHAHGGSPSQVDR